MDIKDWKKRLAKLLKEHPDLSDPVTGHVEINLNRSAVTKAYKVETTVQKEGAVKVTIKTELK